MAIDPIARLRASINLHAVLRNLDDLCDLDPVAAGLVPAAAHRITFVVPTVRCASLTLADGRCSWADAPDRGHARPKEIVLTFTSPAHFNAMMDGHGTPIPVRGFTSLGFLKGDFTALTTRLEHFLRPTPELLRDEQYAYTNTVLTAYTAFFAVAEVGNLDPLGRANAHRIADGVVTIAVAGGPSVSVQASGGHLVTRKGADPRARAAMRFDSIATANGVLSGTLDSYACIGDGRLSIRGHVPTLDHLNKLLAQVSAYVE